MGLCGKLGLAAPYAVVRIPIGLHTSGRLAPIVEILYKHTLGVRKKVLCRGQRSVGDPVLWRADVARLRAFVPGFKAPDLDARLREVLAAWSP